MGNFKLYFFIFLFITLARIFFNYNLTVLPAKMPVNKINKLLIIDGKTNQNYYIITNFFYVDDELKYYKPKFNLTKEEIIKAKLFLKDINYNNNFEKLMYIILSLSDIIGLLGIYGFTFRKFIFIRLFWKIFIFPFSLGECYLIYNSTYNDKLAFIIALLLIIPAPYILFLYIFKLKWE